ncbi:MAG TPA: c-type cytochrome [Steroidobacteraceae bacterium]|jgi:cytochrome c5|nr:c-type cytochrome [Steroidobacteraceae bacterium]
MSKQDTHFVNTFSMVIGLLVLVAIGIIVLARVVAGHTQETDVIEQRDFARSVASRIEPLSQEAIAGQDNTALAIKPDSPAGAGAALPIPKDGAEVYAQVCSSCHGLGLVGAPKAGDAAAWGPRLAKGKNVLYDHALHGFTGSAGTMPAKGNRPDIPDAIIEAGVDQMMSMVKH